jgi:predicted dienelactone hydrolase
MPTTNRTADGTELLAPLVHLNGSSATTLLEGYRAAADALESALDALYATAPNGRDYYAQAENPIKRAEKEHFDRIRRLQSILQEVQLLHENVSDQQDARRKR